MSTTTPTWTESDAATDYRLTRLVAASVYEFKGDETLTQALTDAIGGQRLAANDAYALSDAGALLRTEPDGWLLIGEEPARDVRALLDAATASGYVINATPGYRLLHLKGADAGRLLACFCILDMCSTAFPAPNCRRVPVAQVPMTIYRPSTSAFVLICPASYAEDIELMLDFPRQAQTKA